MKQRGREDEKDLLGPDIFYLYVLKISVVSPKYGAMRVSEAVFTRANLDRGLTQASMEQGSGKWKMSDAIRPNRSAPTPNG